MKKSKLLGLTLALISNFTLTCCDREPVVGPQGLQGETGEKGEDGISIISVDLTSSDGLVDIYTITYSDGTTSNFIVTNGKDGEQGIQGVPGKDGYTPVITISSDGYWVIDGVKTNTKAQGEQGEPGKDGTALLTGNGEPSVNLGKNGDSYIDLDTWNFYVRTNNTWIHVGNIKGNQGNNGVDGAAVLTGKNEPSIGLGKNGDSYIDLSTWNYYVKENGTWVLKGNIKGSDGQDGNGIVSIKLTNTSANVDTYTITFDNGETTTFTVTNGVNGEQGIQGEPGEDGHTPVITIGENGNWYIDGDDTGILAEGIQGPQGEDGLSAYEIYIKYHPEYTGSEEEWLEDLVNGDLREEYKITFQTNGGSQIEPQYVKYGRLVTRPADDPTRTGYLFDGWYLNSELFPFNSYQVYDDLTLLAHWKSMNVNLTLDANGGDVEYNTKTVTYGVDYVLPTPTRANYTFDGWYLDDTLLCPMSGVWTFSKVDITLKARWAGTQAEITFANDDNIQVDNTPITITYGDNFTLPVPTILTGDKFIGWGNASGELVTDENGNSLKPSEFKTNTELHAVYYVPVTTPNQLLNLCTAEAGDERLTRTYVLQNNIDFTGLANESIYNFTGVFDGNGFDIIGLEKPLFGSVGRSDVTCTDDIEVKNVNLVNFSGESFVNQVLGCETFTIDSVTIESFVKDESNYCETYGLIKTIGNLTNFYCPSTFNMQNCHINDEFVTIESGLINYLNYYKNVNIDHCSVKANTKRSAFISSDTYSSSNWQTNFLYKNQKYLVKKEYSERLNIDIYYSSSVTISYCSNYGNSNSLIETSAGQQYYSNSVTFPPIGIDSDDYNFRNTANHFVSILNCINYGDIAESLIINTLKIDSFRKSAIISGEPSSSGYISYGTNIYDNTINVEKLLNFGQINSFFSSNDRKTDNSFNIKSCINAGTTTNASFNITDNVTNNYQFIPLAGIEDSGAFSVSNYSQINSDFFINTIGLDPERWNLSYINIQDEYGLPTIIY